MNEKQRLDRLAEDILASFWFSRHHDEASCSMCDGHGGYHDYTIEWHTALCPVRWAGERLGRDDVLQKGHEIRDSRDVIGVGL